MGISDFWKMDEFLSRWVCESIHHVGSANSALYRAHSFLAVHTPPHASRCVAFHQVFDAHQPDVLDKFPVFLGRFVSEPVLMDINMTQLRC